MPLISVIIPIYNVETYIRKCLDSILAQTHKDWEAILVDDGSLDNSGAICDEYATIDKRFKVIHQKNGGVVNARNKALSVAKGEFLAFVDSDDYIAPTMLEDMVALATKEQLDIVWCDIYVILKEQIRYTSTNADESNEINIKRLLSLSIPGYLPNKIIRKSFWDKCAIITDEKAVICEDCYISLQLLHNNPKNGKINKALYYYNRLNENSATNSNNRAIIGKSIDNITHIYNYLIGTDTINKYYKEFCTMAMWLKFNLLYINVKKARDIFPFAHRNINNYKFRLITSIFYWLVFNGGIIGESILRLHLNYKSQ